MDIELGLDDYWRILRKRRWVLLATALTVFLSAAFYTQFQTPVYKAQALVKFEPPGTKLLGADLPNFDSWTAVQTQVKILASQEMMNRVAQKLRKARDDWGGPLSAERVEGSNLIVLAAKGPDPVGAADLANAAVDAYIERDLEERSAQTRQTFRDVVQRRDEVEQSLRELEDKRQEFLATHQTVGISANLSGQLVDLEARRKDLLKRFTSEHPEVLKIEERIAGMKARLSRAPGQDAELERLVRDIKVNEGVYVELSRKMEESKVALASTVSFVTVISRATAPVSPASPNKRLNYVLGAFLGLFMGFLVSFLLENLDISISTIEEIEKILGVPVLGIIPHFGSEKRWVLLRTRLLRRQRYPMDVFRSQLVFHHRAKSPFIEVYHSLRANIQSQLPKPGNMVLAVTSTGVAEGKTLTAVNFCLSAAHGGLKTLLIGADMRRPVVHRVFGLPKTPGLIEVVTGKLPYQEAVRDTVDFLMGEIDLDKLLAFPGIDNFKIMTGWAASTADLVNILSTPRLPRLIAEMRSEYDLIVFDCPPVLLFVDSLLIAPHADGVVLVYKAGKMARRALKRAKDQVVASKSNIVGIVLNDMQASDMEPRYGYYYDYGHYARRESSE